jgi:hypothetical protein
MPPLQPLITRLVLPVPVGQSHCTIQCAATLLHTQAPRRTGNTCDMNEVLEKSSCVLVALLFMYAGAAGFSSTRRERGAAQHLYV